jgi:Uncharacterized proteins, LmbE homologs
MRSFISEFRAPTLRRPLWRLAYAFIAPFLFTHSATAALPALGLTECHGMKDLVFVAHLDDDLLFMNPDIEDVIEGGGCVTVVYLTASERGEGTGYMLGRERGVRAAYSYMAGKRNSWIADTVQIGNYHLAHFALTANPRVQLMHMRLKDPWLGSGWGSLTPLSQAEATRDMAAETLGAFNERYTRDDLVKVIAELIREYQPTSVRHLDDTISVPYTQLCWRCAGHGHPDHIASARLVRDAVATVPGTYTQTRYIDYPSQEHAANLAASETASKSEIFRRYAWDDYHYCTNPTDCREPAGPAAAWVQRVYYVARRDVAPALVADPRGGLMVAATGESNNAVNVWDPHDRRWRTLGGRTAGSLSTFKGPDGTIGIFALDPLGRLWVDTRAAGGLWQGWKMMDGPHFIQVPTVATREASAAVAMSNEGTLYWAQLTGGGTWTPWRPLPDLPGANGSIALTTDSDGRLAVFANDVSGRILFTTQKTPSDPHWDAWQTINPGPVAGGLAAIRDGDNRIEVYGRQRDTGHLLRIVQQPVTHAETTSRWGTPQDVGIEYSGRPAVDLDAQGAVVLAILERPGGALWLIREGKTERLIDEAASQPAMMSMSGKVYVATRGVGAAQTYRLIARDQTAWNVSAPIGEMPQGGGSPFNVASALAITAITATSPNPKTAPSAADTAEKTP